MDSFLAFFLISHSAPAISKGENDAFAAIVNQGTTENWI
jgi:hypothetical protein